MGNSHSHSHPRHSAQSSSQRLTSTEPDLNGQHKCVACKNLEALIAYWTAPEHHSHGSRPQASQPQLFHNSYAELDECAARCITCRVVRRALVLDQATVNDIQSLAASIKTITNPDVVPQIWAVLQGGGQSFSDGPRLTLILGHREGQASFNQGKLVITEFTLSLEARNYSTAVVLRTGQAAQMNFLANAPQPKTLLGPAALPEPPSLAASVDSDSVYYQVQQWASTCHQYHPECSNLSWSNQVPTRLLRIGLDATTVQLVDTTLTRAQGDTRYTALSYCWGRGRTSNTVLSNIRDRQAQPFSTSDLPRTIRDAILFTARTGIRYIWIDSLCIVQDWTEDWKREAARMHEVYSNAFFTLCAVAVDNADAGLFHPREAWRYPTEMAHLLNWRLRILSRPFQHVKTVASWSSRGWTMQEELLSPRTVYCGPNAVYWSCSQARHMEQHQQQPPAVPTAPTSTNTASAPRLNINNNNNSSNSSVTQSFLQATRSGHALHDHWMSIIETYSARDLANKGDRFVALSGVAARFQARRPRDVYLAGLWQDDLSRGLAWRVGRAVRPRPDPERMYPCPSWSWASLPIKTPVFTARNVPAGIQHSRALFRVSGPREEEESPASADGVGESQDAVRLVDQGSRVAIITAEARMRPLCGPRSQSVTWRDVVQASSHHHQAGRPVFSFQRWLDREVHCVDFEDGQIAVYQPHMQEVVGQLDYLDGAEVVDARPSSLMCLELSSGAMLLLKPRSPSQDSGGMSEYVRVGISLDYRVDFFDGAPKVVVALV